MKVVQTKTTNTTTARTDTPFFNKNGKQDFFNSSAVEHPFFSKNSGTGIQAKLTIGKPNDPYEQEADAMADKVVQRLQEPGIQKKELPGDNTASPSIQAKCNSCEQEEKLQQKEEAREEPDKILKKTVPENKEKDNLQLKTSAEIKDGKKIQSKAEPASIVQAKAVTTVPVTTSPVQTKIVQCEEEEKAGEKEEKGEEPDRILRKAIFESNEEQTASVPGLLKKSNPGHPAIQAQCNECEQEEQLQKKEAVGQSTEQSQPLAVATEGKKIQSKTEPAPVVQPKATPVTTPAVQAKCAACEQEEKQQESEEETDGAGSQLQKKPIFESNADNNDEVVQRSCRECEEGNEIFLKASGIQRASATEATADGSRESIVAKAKGEVGKVQAKQDDGAGKRIGSDRLLEYFHLAAPDVWDDSIIETSGAQMPSWCGIFSVWAHKKAGKDIGNWQMGRGVSAFGTLSQTSDPQPGDIGYIDQPYQHHCIVERVEGDTIHSIDGNSGLFSEVKENQRSRSEYSGFFTAFSSAAAVPDVQASSDGSDSLVQASGNDTTATPAVEQQLSSSTGKGMPLPEPVKAGMEQGFGADFSNVKIHTDSTAVQMNKDLHAQAFTHGRDIYFNSGKYDPASSAGQHLLAHELTHTVQQGHIVQKDTAGTGEQPGNTIQEKTIQRQEVTPNGPAAVLNSSDWVLDDRDTIISFRSGDRLYYVSGAGSVFRVANPQRPEIRQVFGIPATSASGSAVVTTGQGRAIMFDAGSNRGTTVGMYVTQLTNLMARMGATNMTHLEISHAHLDHTNRMEETVRRLNIPAENVIIADFQAPWSANLRDQWTNLARDPVGRRLGYDRVRPGSGIYRLDPAAQYYRVRFQRGDLVIEYRARADAVNTLAATPATTTPAAHLLDSASHLVSLRQSGTGFRMVMLGDLRGRDIEALHRAMESVAPGSFGGMFHGVEVIAGMQHHLGVVETVDDVAGIRRLLEVTALSTGRLEAIVQTDSTQMRPRLVEALNLMGVTVSVTLSGDGTPSSVEVNTASGVSVTGSQAQQFGATQQGASVTRRISELRNLERVFRQYRSTLQAARSFEGPASRVEQEFAQARTELETLYNQRLDATVGRLRGLNRANADSVTFDQSALNTNATEIARERPIDRTLRARDLGNTLRELMQMEAYSAEFDREISRAVRSGEASARMLELINIVSPEYARNVLSRNPPENARQRRAAMRALLRQARLQGAMNTGIRPVPGGRAVNILLLGIEVANMVIPVIQQERISRQGRRFDAYRTLLWWAHKGITPPFRGLIDRWGSADELVTDPQQVMQKLENEELTALLVDPITDEGSWALFSAWLQVHVENFSDYQQEFEETQLPAVRHQGDNFTTYTWQMRVWRWDDSVFGGGMRDEWVDSPQLTTIMRRTAERVIGGTETEIRQTWEQRQPVGQPRPPAFSAPGSRSQIMHGRNPVGRLQFKANATDKNLYSLYRQRSILDGAHWWNDQPQFFELEAENLPAGYKLVMGADYNTYGAIRSAEQYVRDSIPPVIINRDLRPWYDRVFSGPPRSAEEQHALEAVAQERAEYDNSLSTTTIQAYVHFPGTVSNSSAVGLLKINSLEPAPPAPVQRKAEPAADNDPYEREADAMADKIVQRQPASQDDESPVQLKCESCKEKEKIQARAANEQGEPGAGISDQLENSKGQGKQLSADVKDEMGSSLGADFSDVRIHTDSTAVQMNKDLHAQAFTHGSDIYFNAGRYNEDSTDGKRLLAHELTHVVQQGAAGKNSETKEDTAVQLKPEINNAISDSFARPPAIQLSPEEETPGFFNRVGNFVGDIAGGVSETVSGAASAIAGAGSAVLGSIRSTISSGITTINESWNMVQGTASSLAETLQQRAGSAIEFIRAPFSALINAIGNIDAEAMGGAWNTLIGIGRSILGSVQQLIAFVTGSLQQAWQMLTGLITGIVNTVRSLIEGLRDRLGDTVAQVVQQLISPIIALQGSIQNAWNAIMQFVSGLVQDIQTNILAFIQNIINYPFGEFLSRFRATAAIYRAIRTLMDNPDSIVDPMAAQIASRLEGTPAKADELIAERTGGLSTQSEAGNSDIVIQRQAEPRSGTSWAELGQGIARHFRAAWSQLSIVQVIKDALYTLINPIPGTITDWNTMRQEMRDAVQSMYWEWSFRDMWTIIIGHLLNFIIILARFITSVLGRWWLWITIVLTLFGGITGAAGGGTLGAIGGAVFGAGFGALPGVGAGGAVGFGAGAGFGLSVGLAFGEYLLVAYIAVELICVVHALLTLFGLLTQREKERYFRRIVTCLAGAAVGVLLIALSFAGKAIAEAISQAIGKIFSRVFPNTAEGFSQGFRAGPRGPLSRWASSRQNRGRTVPPDDTAPPASNQQQRSSGPSGETDTPAPPQQDAPAPDQQSSSGGSGETDTPSPPRQDTPAPEQRQPTSSEPSVETDAPSPPRQDTPAPDQQPPSSERPGVADTPEPERPQEPVPDLLEPVRVNVRARITQIRERLGRMGAQADEIPVNPENRDLLRARIDEAQGRLNSFENDLLQTASAEEVGMINEEVGAFERDIVNPLQQDINAANIPLATPQEQVLIDQYTDALRRLRQAQDIIDAGATGEALDAARSQQTEAGIEMDGIEAQAVAEHNRPGSRLSRLLDHINTLTGRRHGILTGAGDPAIGRAFPECEAVQAARRMPNGSPRGLNYQQVETAIGREPDRITGSLTDQNGRQTGAVRLEWEFGDGSRMHVDVPGPENTSPYAGNRAPHAGLNAPRPGPGERFAGSNQTYSMTENGVVVPQDSAPAHMPVQPDGQLTYRLRGRGGTE